MFTKSQNDSALDQEIAFALEELKTLRDDPEKYVAVVDRITKLENLKPPKWGLKPPTSDMMLIIGANIFGILWLTRFERENVIPSRSALNFVMKPK